MSVSNTAGPITLETPVPAGLPVLGGRPIHGQNPRADLHRFSHAMNVTGDASAGTALLAFDTRISQASAPSLYVHITSILLRAGVADDDVYLTTTAGHYVELGQLDQLANTTSPSVANRAFWLVRPDQQLYLGRVGSSLTGRLNIYFATNTTSQVYQAIVRGIVSNDYPFEPPLTLK